MSGFEDVPTIDRSTLERYATCPMQARLCAEIVRSAGSAAASGNSIHHVFSEIIQWYIDERGCIDDRELAERTTLALQASRPDVQPDAIAGARRSVWEFAKLVGEQKWWKDPETGKVRCTILRFDGGQGSYGGQLSFEMGSTIVTGELDLLLSTASPQVVNYIDYKTGHKYWTETDVAKSFQFQFYSALVLENYPEVECVRVSVWNTRSNVRTYAVEFTRKYDLPQIRSRINSALGEWWKNRGAAMELVAAWPARDKCEICPALAICPAADADLKTDPVELLNQFQLVDLKGKEIKRRLSAIVAETGRDVVSGAVAFGYGKPPSKRKPTAALYGVSGEDGDE